MGMTKSTTGYWHPDAPTRYNTNRRCSRGIKCLTYEQCQEVGKIRSTKPPLVNGDDIRGIPEVVLCSLCERAWLKTETPVHKFAGVQKKGKITSYFLPSLRKIRRSKGLRQYELARIVECSTETVEAAERTGDRRRRVSTKMAGKLARALGTSVNELREI